MLIAKWFRPVDAAEKARLVESIARIGPF